MKRINFPHALLLAFLCSLFALAGTSAAYAEAQEDLELPAPASPKKSIRFYKVNKQMQGDRVMLTPKKSTSPGCQNFLKAVRVHKAVQTGYTACLLYAEKDCKHASVVDVAREENPRRTYFLTEGFGWMPQSDDPRGVKLGSWDCGATVEPEQLGEEAMLAAAEVKRLAKVAEKAAEKADKAQKKANKAQKSADKAIEQAQTARKRAIAAGVDLPNEETEPSADGTEGDEEDESEETGE